MELGGGYERCGPAADAVEERHHLRNGRHLHDARRGDSDNGSHRHPRCDQPVLVDVRIEEREDDGDGHPDRRDHVPGTGRRRSAEAANPDDQEDGRDEIGEVDRRLRQRERSRHLRLNISSMRSADPATSMAPTRTIPWIAFVPDISGVCSIAGTLEMISKPMKTARTKMVMLLRRLKRPRAPSAPGPRG